MRIETSQLVET